MEGKYYSILIGSSTLSLLFLIGLTLFNIIEIQIQKQIDYARNFNQSDTK